MAVLALAGATLIVGFLQPGPAVPTVSTQPVIAQQAESSDAISTVLAQRGDRGDTVRNLQQRLADKGFAPGPVDGIYGRKTAAAVSSMQRAVGLTETGKLDAASSTALDAYQAPTGSTAASNNPSPTMSIREAQQHLVDAGFNPGPVDGLYGRKTRTGIEAFQRQVGLAVTGKVDAATASALASFDGRASGVAGDNGGGADPTDTNATTGDASGATSTNDAANAKTATKAYQQQLADGPFDPGLADGSYGTKTKQAIWSLEKLAGLSMDGSWGDDDQAALEGVLNGSIGGPAASYERRWVEVDLSQQLMMIYDPGQTVPVLVSHVSSGSGIPWRQGRYSGKSITPTGEFTITRRIRGWRESSLGIGRLYNPLYFTSGGIAFHGATSVPSYPASHGCVRVPMHIAEYLPSLLPNGTPVVVRD